MQEREQIITFLLQSCDSKTQVIADLQKRNTELEKRIAEISAISPVPNSPVQYTNGKDAISK